jgi:2-amino-4-hydroxy-6-hydroxymethyldihydropteridine diphosphokinase
LRALDACGVRIEARSAWYRTAPVPASGQPWFVNLVVRVATALPPEALLAEMQRIEREIGRLRGARNAARIVDLDLLDYDGRRLETATLTLPHPRLAERAFVLVPLRDVAPDWRHPVSGLALSELLARLPAGQAVVRDNRGPAA